MSNRSSHKSPGSFQTRIDTNLFNWVYPFILFAAGIARNVNIISILYLITWIIVSCFYHPTHRRGDWIIKTSSSFVAIVSSVAILGSGVITILNHLDRLDSYLEFDSDAHIGFVVWSSGGIPIASIIGDVVVLLSSVYFFIRSVILQSVTYRSLRDYNQSPSRTIQITAVILLMICGAIDPTFLHLFYFVFFLVALACYILADLVIFFQRTFSILGGYLIINGAIIYLYQIRGWDDIDGFRRVGTLLGIRVYDFNNFQLEWPAMASDVAKFLLFTLICQVAKRPTTTLHMRDLSRTSSRLSEASSLISMNSKVSVWTSISRIITRFFRAYGWKICILALLLNFLIAPTMMNLVSIPLVALGLLLTEERARKIYFIFATPLIAMNCMTYLISIPAPEISSLFDYFRYQLNSVTFPLGLYVLANNTLLLFLVIYWQANQGVPYVQLENQVEKKLSFLSRLLNDVFSLVVWLVLNVSYVMSMVGLYLSGLTAINLLNAGYMCFFITFILSVKLASKWWLFLVLYSEFVVILLSVWQVPWTLQHENEITKLIGLHHYDPLWKGIGWNLVIMVFTSVQWWLLQLRQSSNNVDEPQVEFLKLPGNFRRLLKELTYIFYEHGVFILANLALLLVALLNNPPTVQNIGYVTLAGLCAIFYSTRRNPLPFVKAVWGPSVILIGIVLIVRYAYQFPILHEHIESPSPEWVPLEEFGLIVYPISDLFLGLLPNTVVLILAVFQSRIWFSSSKNDQVEIRQFQLEKIYQFGWRFLFLHSSKILILVTWLCIISEPERHVLGIGYLLILLGYICSSGNSKILGIFTIVYSYFCMVLTIAVSLGTLGRFRDRYRDWGSWIGILGPLGTESLWELGKADLLIFCFAVIHTLSRLPPKERPTSLFDWTNVRMEGDENQVEDQVENQDEVEFRYRQLGTPKKRMLWYVENFLVLFGWQILLICIVICLAFRNNVLGVFYICFVGFSLVFGIGKSHRALGLILPILSALIVVQFIFVVGPPPIDFTYPQFLNPWEHWLLIVESSPAVITTDILILWFTARLWLVPSGKRSQVEKIHDRIQHEQLGLYIHGSEVEEVAHVKIHGDADADIQDENDLAQHEDHTSLGRVRREGYFAYLVLRYSLDVILIAVFILSTLRASILTLGYMGISLGFLLRITSLLKLKNKVWRWFQLYNFLAVAAEIVYQVPLFPESEESFPWEGLSWPETIGLFKISADEFVPTAIFYHVIIMVLLYIQHEIFDSKELEAVDAKIRRERERAMSRAHKYFDELERENIEKREKYSENNKELWERLQLIKERHDDIAQERELLIPFEKAKEERRHDGSPEFSSRIQLEAQERRHRRKSNLLVQLEKMQKEEKAKKEAEEKIEIFRNQKSKDQVENQVENQVEKQVEKQVQVENEIAPEVAPEAQEADGFKLKVENFKSILKLGFHHVKKWSRDGFEHIVVTLEDYQRFKAPKEEQGLILRFFRALSILIPQCSKALCIGFFILNNLVYGNVLSTLFAIGAIGYALMVPYPFPGKHFWNMILFYTTVTITTKFIAQLPLFCTCNGENYIYWSIAPRCANPRKEPVYPCNNSSEDELLNIPGILGISADVSGSFLWQVILDFIVLLTVLWHRSVLKKNGLWNLMKEKKGIALDSPKPESNGRHVQLETKDVQVEDQVESQDEMFPDVPRDEEKGNIRDYGSLDYEADFQVETPGILERIKQLGMKVYDYHRRLLDEKKKVGADYYTILFVVEFVCFIYLVLFPNDFSGIPDSDVLYIISQSRIPISYLLYLLGQFALIIVDRIIYLYKSIRAKLILTYVLIVVYHYMLIFYLPQNSNKIFSQKPYLVIFYLLKVIYLVYSALQVCEGYTQSFSRFFTKKPSLWRQYLFKGYRAIPFAFELKTLLDFIVHDTTLSFNRYLKLEDLYSELFLVFCDNHRERQARPKKGIKQTKMVKCTDGVLLFLFFTILLWFPLLLLSSESPTNSPNLVERIQGSLGVVGWNPFYEINQNVPGDSVASSEMFGKIRKNYGIALSDEARDTQILYFDTDSESLWQLTPPSELALINHLNKTEDAIQLQITIKFWRPNPPSQMTIEGSMMSAELSMQEKSQILDAIVGSANLNENGTYQKTIEIQNLGLRFLRLPLIGSVQFVPSKPPVRILLTMHAARSNFSGNGILRWWSIHQVPDGKVFENSKNGVFQFVAISTEAPTVLTGSIATAGLIGLYVTVVLSVGRFLRLFVSGLIQRIHLDEMPDVEPILILCEDIFTTRNCGELVLEEQLFTELMELFRNPSRLAALTKRKEKEE